MWRCCVCLNREFTLVTDYADHVQLMHTEWLDGRRVPPPAMKPDWVVERDAEKNGWWV